MLTNDEKLFIEYWEKNRDKEKHFMRQLAGGLPIGLVFALPVLVVVIFHNWYKSMTYISGSQIIVIIIGVLGIAVFFALFRMKFKWENNEQLYKELKFKQKIDDAALQ
jgi:pilus assembly protein TadC